mgnify:CR=1 FL=1
MPAGSPFLSLKLYGSYSSLPITITGRSSVDVFFASCAQPTDKATAAATTATVKKSIKRLEELGYIKIQKRKGLAGNFNIYKNLKHIVNINKKAIKTKEIVKKLNDKVFYKDEKVNDENKDIAFQIADKVKMIQSEYTRKLDIDIEKLVFTLYDIDKEEVNIICETLNSLPDLSAINHMKTKDGELDV